MDEKIVREIKEPYIEVEYTYNKSDKFPKDETHIRVVMGIEDTIDEVESKKILEANIRYKLEIMKKIAKE